MFSKEFLEILLLLQSPNVKPATFVENMLPEILLLLELKSNPTIALFEKSFSEIKQFTVSISCIPNNVLDNSRFMMEILC